MKSFMEKRYEIKLKLDEIDFKLSDGIVISSLGFDSPDLDSLISIEKISLNYSIKDIIKGKFIINEIKTDSLRFRLISKDDISNLQKLIDRFKSSDETFSEDKKDSNDSSSTYFKIESIILNNTSYYQSNENFELLLESGDLSAELTLDKGVSSIANLNLKNTKFNFKDSLNNIKTISNGSIKVDYGKGLKGAVSLNILNPYLLINNNNIEIDSFKLNTNLEFNNNFTGGFVEYLDLDIDDTNIDIEDFKYEDTEVSSKKIDLKIKEISKLMRYAKDLNLPAFELKDDSLHLEVNDLFYYIKKKIFRGELELDLGFNYLNFKGSKFNDLSLNFKGETSFSSIFTLENGDLSLKCEKIEDRHIPKPIEQFNLLVRAPKIDPLKTKPINIGLTLNSLYSDSLKIISNLSLNNLLSNISPEKKVDGNIEIEGFNIDYRDSTFALETDLFVSLNKSRSDIDLSLSQNNIILDFKNIKKEFKNLLIKSGIKLYNLNNILVENLDLKLDNKLSLNLDSLLYRDKNMNLKESLVKSKITESDIAPFLPDSLLNFKTMDIDLSLSGKSNLKSDNDLLLKHKIYVDSLYSKGAFLDSLNLEGSISQNRNYTKLLGTYGFRGSEYEGFDISQFENFDINYKLYSDNFKNFSLNNFSLKDKNGKFTLDGRGGYSLDSKRFNLNLGLDSKLDTLSIVKGLSFKGEGTKVKIVASGNTSLVDYTLNLNNSYRKIEYRDSTSIVLLKNYYQNLPVSGKIDLKNLEIYQKRDDRSGYINPLEYFQEFQEYNDSLNFKSLEFTKDKIYQKIENFKGRVSVDGNRFTIRNFIGKYLNGDITGSVNILGNRKIKQFTDSIHTKLSLYFIGINPKLINEKNISNYERGEISLRTDLDIVGTTPKNGSFNGKLNLTGVGSSETDTILGTLSKLTNDQSVNSLRNILQLFPGVKVSLFSVGLVDNFIYISVNLDKPWYLFYFPLPNEINFSRQSLKFYFDRFLK
ncbi:MAG: hypothetical protein CR982_06480 [Candidatus Cloacimonadota bacterium]|nr:MAG: hypothetical protein CR982_06480 [Candidatus Cloacimonadota bacterium]PIE79935.1 MAG: hypothetical protein CSA15_02400 [Candidatus Delongbacteria bacterium]